jgi:hypothetical protein
VLTQQHEPRGLFARRLADHFRAPLDGGINGDAIPDGPPVSALPESVYRAGPIRTGDMRIGELDARPTISHPDIEIVQRGGVESDAHLAGGGFGDGVTGDVGQGLGGTVFVEQNGFHGNSFPLHYTENA